MTGKIGRIGLLVVAGLVAAMLGGPASAQADTCVGAGEPLTADINRSERSLLCLTNIHRVANGAGPLAMDPILRTTARAYSEDMLNRSFFNHFGGPGCDEAQGNSQSNGCSMPWHRAMANGFPTDQVGENIARGYLPTPVDTFQGFRNSPGHNANMLAPAYVTAGMGIANGAYVTENFSTTATGATDTAVDLLITDECVAAGNALTPLETAFAAAKKRFKKAKKKQKGIRGAKKRFKKAKKKLVAGQTTKKTQCRPRTSY